MMPDGEPIEVETVEKDEHQSLGGEKIVTTRQERIPLTPEEKQEIIDKTVDELVSVIDQRLMDLTGEQFRSVVLEMVIDEMNKRVVGPLISGTALLLLLATLGAFLYGQFVIGLIILPGPIIAGWALWKSRQI